MLDQLKDKIETTVKSEDFQRAVLTGATFLVAITASRIASSLVTEGGKKLTDALMAKWHPEEVEVEIVPAE